MFGIFLYSKRFYVFIAVMHSAGQQISEFASHWKNKLFVHTVECFEEM